jgi:hypothetical protein
MEDLMVIQKRVGFALLLIFSGHSLLYADRVQNVAEAIPWVDGSPHYSDVLMRSLTRYDGTVKSLDQGGNEIYPNAITASGDFHVSKIVWSYVDPTSVSHRNFISQFTNRGIPFFLSNMTGIPKDKAGEWGLETITNTPARRPFDGMLFACRNKESFRNAALLDGKNKIDNLPLVTGSNVYWFQQDDPRSQATASLYGSVEYVGCFCASCSSKFAAKCEGGEYRGNAGDIEVSTSVLKNLKLGLTGGPVDPNDVKAFQAFARDSDEDYIVFLRAQLKAHVASTRPGARLVFSSNSSTWSEQNSPDLPEYFQTAQHFDFWLSEVAHDRHTPEWFWQLKKNSGKYIKKTTITSSKHYSKLEFRRIIAGSYAVGLNYIVPWDMYLIKPPAKGRLYTAKEDFADLYGYIRGLSATLDGYEDAYAASKVVVSTDAINDPRLAGSYSNIPPVKIESDHEKLYAFVRAKPGDMKAPVAIHIVDWSMAPQSSTVTVDRSRYFPNKQLNIQWFTPKSYNATLHETAETTKNYSLLVASVSPTFSWNGRDTVKIFLPPATPWGTLVVQPMPINPPANVGVSTITARGAHFHYDANDNPAGTEYRIFLSSTGATGSYFQVLSTTSLSPQVSGLTPNTTYHARVRAVQAGGVLSWSAVMKDPFQSLKEDMIAPGAPGIVTVSAIGGGRARLSWGAAADNVGVTGYELERCVGAGCSNYVGIATLPVVGAVTKVDTTTFPGHLIGVWTGGDQFKQVVQNQKISIQGTTYSLTGDSTVGNLYLPLTAVVSVGDAVAFGDPLMTTDPALSSSTVHLYRIRARDASGNVGPYSPVATLTTPDVTAPVVSLTAPAAGSLVRGAVTLSASAVDDVGVTSVVFAVNGVVVSTDTAAPYEYPWDSAAEVANKEYALTARAYDKAGNSAISAPVTVTVLDGAAPGVPGIVAVSAIGGGRARLSWGAAADNVGVTGYELERCVGAGCSNYVRIATLPVVGAVTKVDRTTFLDRVTLLWTGGDQFKQVAWKQKITVGVTTHALTSDSTVGNLYLPLTAVVSVGDAVAFGDPLMTTDPALSSSTVHLYRIRARDASGNVGPYSPVATLTTNETAMATVLMKSEIPSLPAGVDGGRAYPVPYRSNSGAGGITFDRLPEGARIRIFTLGGRLVRELTTDGSGRALWGVDNDGGQPLPSGVYVVLLEGNGTKKSTKIMVQR